MSPPSGIGPSSCSTQFAPGLGGPTADMTDVPFISQIEMSPFEFCHRMSDLPSPLASLVPSAFHEIGGVGSVAVAMTEVPFISQMIGVPFAFCHRMSAWLSPLKSPVPTAREVGVGGVSATALMIEEPFIS